MNPRADTGFEDSLQSRGERLIAGLRTLVALGLLALPLAPGATASAFALLAVYLLYSLLLAVLLWGFERVQFRWRLAAHTLDLAVFAIFCALTWGAVPPALVFLAFLLLAGGARWRGRGAAGTAVAGLAAYGIAGLLAGLSPERLAAGSAPLALLAALVVCASIYQQRLGREMLRIAAWPRSSLQDTGALLDHLLAHAAGILEAPRVLLVWEEVDEPWLHLAHRTVGGVEVLREPPPADSLVPPPLAAASFLSNGPQETWHQAERGIERWRGAPVGEDLRRRFAIERVASWPVRGGLVQGRLFALDRRDFERDHLVLGEIVAQRIAAELDQLYLTRHLRTAAVAEERVRLACDLHDGMLQSLTGAALQLQALAGLLEEEGDRQSAREQLREVQRLIASDQRDLRFFIEELKPVPRTPAGVAGLADRLEELAERLKRLWGLRVEVRLHAFDGQISEAFTRQLYRLLREALFNVARHAGATTVRVEVSREGRTLRIAVTDDGRGFPFQGRYDHEELTRRKLGPVSLKERISTLGGSLAIDTAPGHTRLEVLLPTGGGIR
jgi:signal transduction histidine kinase